MELASQTKCTGCGACVKACSHHAIEFRDDGEGFPVPVIRAEKCVECGICRNVCPALELPQTHKIRKAYAAAILDQDALKESTSGGVFTALSREIFRRGGVVYGCVWDGEYHAILQRAEREEEILPMRGSKYVWSDTRDTYPQIKDDLKSGRTVLFTGLPCQAAGLRKYLGKEYPALYVVSCFCGGVPSPLAFRKYLESLTRHVPIGQLNLKFRDKEKHGAGVDVSYQGRFRRVHQSFVRNSYYFSFFLKLILRPSCYHCPYRYENRIDDLTLGDYWGVGKYHPEFSARAGVSALLVNTDRGGELLDAVKDQLQISETKTESIAGYNNLTLGPDPVTFQPPLYRKAFFDQLKEKGWKSAEYRYLYRKSRWKLFLRENMPKSILRFKNGLFRKRKK